MSAYKSGTLVLVIFAGSIAAALPLEAVVEPRADSLQAKEFHHAELIIPDAAQPLPRLPAEDAAPRYVALNRLGIAAHGARVDERGGRFETLLPSQALIAARTAPGQSRKQRAAEARDAFTRFLDTHRTELGIDTGELGAGRVTVHGDGTVVQIYLPRVVGGIPVRGSYVHGVVNHGKLNLFGIRRWGDVEISLQPRISAAEAADVARAHLEPHPIDGLWDKDQLLLVPTAEGEGYGHRLAWQLHPTLEGELGRWEVLVDASTGELLAAEDTNVYAEVKGGVYPVTNDGVSPDGVEQSGWPMPFDFVSTSGGTQTSDTGGNVVAVGSMTSSLSGPFVDMNDNCGSISLTQTGIVDFGTSGGDDCTTPGFGGAGNTHASRTGFYELNRIAEMARGWLPTNSWLQQQLTANMNINNTCNAFWNGVSVNFYRSGGGCFNTGEIAGVLDHEWGHGMDDNDAFPTIADPSGEGIADVYAALRLNDSCIGRNFRSSLCSGFGDPCLTCTGVRDIDYLERQSGLPHDYTWSNANCGSSVHCIGAVYAEAIWSLWKRELQAAPYNMSDHTAHELVNRLTFVGGGIVGTWFSGGPPFGGCSAIGGYLNFLAADDDDGDLNNGTPHMTAIYEAFNDQEIACDTPAVTDSGCANTPTVAPTVFTSTGNQQVDLTWGAVPNATEYQVFRAEGVFACDFGKVKIGATTGTSWNDTGLQNGRDYSYVVIPIGAADSCIGPASSCATAQPVGLPDFALACSPANPAVAQGDGGTSTCTVVSSFGYTGSVNLSCSGNPAAVGCSFSPPSVTLPADGSADSTLTISVDLAQAVGTVAFDVVSDDGSATRTVPMSVEVLPEGTQQAVYNPVLGAPECSAAGSSCDSRALLDGRDGVGSEPNQPNTLDGCADGTAGIYHSDESIDRIVVSTLDGSELTEDATVRIDATVWSWGNGSLDTLDLYYAADANSPSWVYITSIMPPAGGQQTLSAQYTLPASKTQAVRANFRFLGSASPCSTGPWDDHDDLVFTLGNLAPAVQITAPADGTAVTEGTAINFAGTAPDVEDGDLSAGLSWTSSLDGPIGSGASFVTSSLSCGVHSIDASVTDSGGRSGFDAINVAVTGAVAVPVAVDNFSFETPALADGAWTPNIPSWTQIDGTSGIFNPTTAQFPAGVPDGDNSAFINGGTIGQTIASETLLADAVYTLSVDVGDRADKGFPGYEIQLVVDGVVRASADETSATPADGAFATATASFATTAADAGRPLEIRLLTSGQQPNFDNVRLTWSPCGETPPVVSITSPTDGSSFVEGASVSFAATATDAEDGDLSASLSWTSSLDGAIGSGASFSTSSLSVGSHTITASVSDSSGLPGSDSISITIVPANTPPVVTIASPANGSLFTPCDTVGFAGTAADTEDGDLSAGLSWTSSLDGAIGTGASFSATGLSLGSHTITASVTDPGGLSGSDMISITVTDVLAIAVDNFSFETPALADGGWTPTVPSWSQLAGTGGIFDPTAAQFPGGVPDGQNSAYLNGGTLGQTIAAETLRADTTYTLEVDVGDRADKPFPGYEIQLLVNGALRASADETSVAPPNGAFATATASFTTAPADAGQSVEIRLLAPSAQPNFDNVRLTRSVVCGVNSPPVVAITSPADGSSFVEGVSVSFAATATDAEDGDLAAGLSWTSSLDGAIGSGASFATSSLSCGAHVIDASVTDSGGVPGSDAVAVTVTGAGSSAIVVDNFSFEEPVLGDGKWTSGIPSWTQIAGTSGVVNPTTVQFPAGVPDGDNSAFSNGGTIGQIITAETLLADTIYTLEVDVGNRADKPFPGYEIQLLVDGTVRASADETSVSPADGLFATATASFTTELADAGQSLEIRLLSSGEQVNFDDVRLTRSVCGGNAPPVVTITGPADGSSFVQGASVGFAATATDLEDGDLAAGLSWTSNLDGAIGTGASFSTSTLSCGVHVIDASVADSGGLPGSDAIAVTVTGSGSVSMVVDNFSFETPALVDGGWTPSIPSWTQISGTSGIFDPTTAQFPAGVPDGDNSAFINGGTIGQTIAAETLLADTTYTLEVDVGDRADKAFPGYEIQLVVGGVVRASADETAVSPADGAFATATASFTATAADAGLSLEIRLVTPGQQPNFDNVRLTRSVCN